MPHWRAGAARAQRRATTPDPKALPCVYCLDGTPSERKAGKGLSPRMCRPHREHLARHGHPTKRSYTAVEVRPYIRVAERFIRDALAGKVELPARGAVDPAFAIRGTIQAYRGLLMKGRVRVARDLPRSPQGRAIAILARLRHKYLERPIDEARKAKVRQLDEGELAIRLAAVVVGLRLAHEFDPEPGGREFLEVQIGKAVHRLAGGYHRVRVIEAPAGQRPMVLEQNHYGASRGAVLARLGKLARQCDYITGEVFVWPVLLEAVKAAVPALPVANGADDGKRGDARGGRRRAPYREWAERGHNRVR